MRFPCGGFLAALACITLAGCGSNGSIKESLGLTRQGPDEYRVVSRPPLSVPPEFNLRPPGQQESTYVSGKTAAARAHEEVLGNAPAGGPTADTAVAPVMSGDLPSGSDAQFLADAAGGTKVDPQIRQKLLNDKWNGAGAKDPNYLFSGKKEGDPVVDAEKEKQRLQKDQAQNKPPTEGDTPVIEPEDKGLLGTIF